MERLCDLEKDYYCDDISDGANATDSSDEDLEQMLEEFTTESLGRSTIVHQLTPALNGNENRGDEDDFEAEMNSELSSSFESHRNDWLSKMRRSNKPDKSVSFADFSKDYSKFVPCTSGILNPPTTLQTELDDEGQECDAADSDEEFYDHEKPTLKECSRTNDELLYDPNSDNNDQEWVDNQRRMYHKNGKNSKTKSDAILNCPACMSVLCYDCQRHDVYKTQYRAVFVTNCQVDNDEILFVPREIKAGKKNKTKSKASKNKISQETEEKPLPLVQKFNQRRIVDEKLTTNLDPADLFKPVRCIKCKSEVAVCDSDEIYHFFNVLSSYV